MDQLYSPGKDEFPGAIADIPPGALPMPTLPTPRYTPLNPPLCQNPLLDCIRVLTVSRGKNMKSTAIPETAPDYDIRGEEGDSALRVLRVYSQAMPAWTKADYAPKQAGYRGPPS